jgi:serine/tyrosine/threonine adenylyltransferase
MFPEAPNLVSSTNPFTALNYEPAIASLGDEYYDIVEAAEFPRHILRFRNDDLLPKLGLDPQSVTDADFIFAFGCFLERRPFLALRYHGYQFGEYNPALGDGRGFLYGQVRGTDGELYDFGTKGSGTTPYSRGGDGRLTLKGGIREVLAAEMLHRLGVRTSRCLSLVETGDSLWRGDEPSPTRASVMIRFSRSHIRFGTFERLHYLDRPDLIQKLLDHVITYYYPHLQDQPDRYAQFYTELVQRTAELAAQWVSVGFCHAVLNTDNMSITGESFDYGPYAFIDRYDPKFTAAYFDYFGRYSYGNQPMICRLNLEMLQVPLQAVISKEEMAAGLAQFEQHYFRTYEQRMLRKLGFEDLPDNETEELLQRTIQLLQETQVGYHDFFIALRQQFSRDWRENATHIFSQSFAEQTEQTEKTDTIATCVDRWRQFYHHLLLQFPEAELDRIAERLAQHNPTTVIIRPEIEAVWEPIAESDNWTPFYELLQRIRTAVKDS